MEIKKEGKGILRVGYGSEGSSLKTFFNSKAINRNFI